MSKVSLGRRTGGVARDLKLRREGEGGPALCLEEGRRQFFQLGLVKGHLDSHIQF